MGTHLLQSQHPLSSRTIVQHFMLEIVHCILLRFGSESAVPIKQVTTTKHTALSLLFSAFGIIFRGAMSPTVMIIIHQNSQSS
jgi:hypothetical protein